MTSLHASAFMNSQRDPEKTPEPFRPPVPWPDESAVEEEVTPEERLRLRERLIKHSAFANQEQGDPDERRIDR